MSEQDTKQVGGDHYGGPEAKVQHWDLVVRCLGNRYLEGNATKYLDRCMKKNGVQDLEKARSYIAKLRAEFKAGRVLPPELRSYFVGELSPLAFCKLRGHDTTVTTAIINLCTWEDEDDLALADAMTLLAMTTLAEVRAALPTSGS